MGREHASDASVETAAKDPNSGRILAVSALLRAGHTGAQVSAAIKVIDAGGSLDDVWKALKEQS